MKIISLHAVAFGKLKDVRLQFHDGINVLRNVNSFGKTTMAGFIRAMLYGLGYTKKGINNVYHYAPWDSTGKFGGSIVIEQDNETYRIERFFGMTAKQETLTVTNEKTGVVLNWPKQPGEIILGLTADSYDRSAYFPQEAVALESNENLDSRLANLVQNSAEDYDKIQKKLREYKKNLRYERGSGGELYELECKKLALEQQLVGAQNAEKRAEEIDKRLADIAEESTVLSNRQQTYNKQLTKLQQEMAQSQPSDEDKRIKARIAELSEKLSRIPDEFDADFERLEQLAKQIAEVSVVQPQPPQQERKPSAVTMILSGALLVVGLILFALGIAKVLPLAVGVAIGCACVGIGCIVIGIVTVMAKKRNNTQTNNIQPIASPKDELTSQYLAIAGKYVFTDGVDYETIKRALWDKYREYQGDLRERDTLLSVGSNTTTDTTHIEQEILTVQNALEAISRQINNLATEKGSLTEERKGLKFNSVEIVDQLMEVDKQYKEARHRLDVVEKVIQLLEQAKDNLSSSYLPRLCARCTELVKDITQTDFEIAVDRSFAINIREKGVTRPMSEYSRGIREITLLCFRIALSELLYDGAVPFVIIDDAFVNYDELNFIRATELLKNLAKYAQVIYFTCHDRMGNLLK